MQPIFNFMAQQHKWKPGEWCCYGDYVHRDDTCRCGCTRRVAVCDDGAEVCEFYEFSHNITRGAPPCTYEPEISSDLILYIDPDDKSEAGRRKKYNNLLFLIGESNIYY